jgi:3-oxoacyl-[acyl-carrier protein] reductase
VNNAGESSQRAVDGVHWQVNSVDSPGQDLPSGRFEAMSDQEFRDAFEQKCLGMIRVTRAFLPAMRKSGNASVVNVTSIKGIQPPPRVVTSGIAWAAAMNFSKALSFELASEGIRVNVVSVGGIMTPQMEAGRKRWAPEKTLDEFLAKRVANIPLKRLGSSEEVADAIVYFARPGSGYVTGQVMAVDGGGLRSL